LEFVIFHSISTISSPTSQYSELNYWKIKEGAAAVCWKKASVIMCVRLSTVQTVKLLHANDRIPSVNDFL